MIEQGEEGVPFFSRQSAWVEPVYLPGELPVGVQLIARPDDEQSLFTVAIALERMGIIQAPVAGNSRR